MANEYLEGYHNGGLSRQDRFEAIIFFTAKEETLEGDNIESQPEWLVQKTLTDLYKLIAIIFKRDDLLNKLDDLEYLNQAIRQLLKQERTLIILDNLDTVDDKLNQIYDENA